jgi:hypothetical protein
MGHTTGQNYARDNKVFRKLRKRENQLSCRDPCKEKWRVRTENCERRSQMFLPHAYLAYNRTKPSVTSK